MHVPGLVWRAYFSFKSGMEIPKNREVLSALNPVYKYFYWNKDATVQLYFLFIESFCFVPVAGSRFSSHLLQAVWLDPSCANQTSKTSTHTQPCIWARVLESWYNCVPYHRFWLAVVEVRHTEVGEKEISQLTVNRQTLNLCTKEQRRRHFKVFFCFFRTVPGTCQCLCHGCTPPPPSGFWTACMRCCAGPYSSLPVTTQQKHLSGRVSCYNIKQLI